MKTLKEIQARKAEIRELLKGDGADLEVLEKELDQLEIDERAIVEATEQRAALVARVVGAPALAVVRSFPGPGMAGTTEGTEERSLGADSPEYRAAFLKTLARNKETGEWRLGELTDVEQRAFTFTTATTASVLPTEMSTRIWDLVTEKYAIINDVTMQGFQHVYEFLQNTAIVAGDAAVSAENVSPDDMELAFIPKTLDGVEVKALVKISRKMQIQSMQGFENYLVTKVSSQIGVQLNKVLTAAIEAGIPAPHKYATAVGVAVAIADIRKAFGSLKGASRIVVYANLYTIYNVIAAIEDDIGRPYFLQSTVTDDPAVKGSIYGAVVKLDDTLADGVFYVGDPGTVEANLFQDVEIISMVDVNTHGMTHSGYALFDADLGDTRAWAKVTATPAV